MAETEQGLPHKRENTGSVPRPLSLAALCVLGIYSALLFAPRNLPALVEVLFKKGEGVLLCSPGCPKPRDLCLPLSLVLGL